MSRDPHKLLMALGLITVLTCTSPMQVAGASVGEKSLQEMTGTVDEVMQTIRTNIQTAWSAFPGANRDGGHFMVVALNEVRKYNNELRHQIEELEQANNLILHDVHDEVAPVQRHESQLSQLERAKIETTYEEFAERARKEATVKPNRSEIMKEAMESIKERTKRLIKSLFVEELRETAQLMLILWSQSNSPSVSNQSNLFSQVTLSFQTKMLHFLVGVFTDLIPCVLGKRTDAGDPFSSAMLRDANGPDDAAGDDETIPRQTTTTEHPFAWMLYNWID